MFFQECVELLVPVFAGVLWCDGLFVVLVIDRILNKVLERSRLVERAQRPHVTSSFAGICLSIEHVSAVTRECAEPVHWVTLSFPSYLLYMLCTRSKVMTVSLVTYRLTKLLDTLAIEPGIYVYNALDVILLSCSSV